MNPDERGSLNDTFLETRFAETDIQKKVDPGFRPNEGQLRRDNSIYTPTACAIRRAINDSQSSPIVGSAYSRSQD